VNAPASRIVQLPEADRQILRERAVEVARRQESSAPQDGVDIVEVHSRGQMFGIPLAGVASITELSSLAPVPRAPMLLRGLVNVRGEVLVGIELALLTGTATGGIADLRRIIAVTAGDLRIAVLAEKIASVRTVQTSAFRSDGVTHAPYIVGTDEHFLSLVDPAALIKFAFGNLGRSGT
jgi:purine-binding chemotaxis protein CheW